jgi:hypothetical protein
MRLLLALCALLIGPPAWATPEPVARVTVERNGKAWTASYELLEGAPVWLFAESVLPRESKVSWRLGSVRVLTPGIKLRRLGNYDALVAARGNVPRRVRLSFTPFTRDIEAGYDAALAFTDGSVALYADQFKLVPIRSVAAARRLPPDNANLPAVAHPTLMTFADRAGPVLVHGKREARPTLSDGQAYVLFGKANPAIGEAMTTIIDPALPRWIADDLNHEMPKILGRYRDELGPSPVGQPTLLVSWAGPKPETISLGGSVLPGMVVMTLEGDALLKPNAKASQYGRWFISHEAAHFWLGQAVHYSTPAESWITEGGAELLAFRATAATDPSFDIKARLSEAKAECTPFLANGGIADAYQREGDFRAYYACGAMLALAAEKASRGDFADFVRTLINRSAGDQTVTRREWLALLEERAPGGKLSAAVRNLLDKRQADPAAALDAFIATADIADEFKAPEQ